MGLGTVKESVANGKTYLGIEFGSTRIKAVLIDENHDIDIDAICYLQLANVLIHKIKPGAIGSLVFGKIHCVEVDVVVVWNVFVNA